VKVVPARLGGVFRVEMERRDDSRGFFARSWCAREAEALGHNPHVVQCNVSFNHRRGTLRGLHYQTTPHQEAKLVRCTRGALVDIVLDIRTGSATFGTWEAFDLTADNGVAIYIPEGLAHGFQTVEDRTEVLYQMSEFYVEQAARGVRWNDPAFRITWPLPDPIVSLRDAAFPDFTG
jgi:dTDP-4-dehydrorhamnose 3,5-epimerase